MLKAYVKFIYIVYIKRTHNKVTKCTNELKLGRETMGKRELKGTLKEKENELKERKKELEERRLYFLYLCESYEGLFSRVNPLSDEFEAAYSGLMEARKQLQDVAVELIQVRMQLSSTMYLDK